MLSRDTHLNLNMAEQNLPFGHAGDPMGGGRMLEHPGFVPPTRVVQGGADTPGSAKGAVVAQLAAVVPGVGPQEHIEVLQSGGRVASWV